MLLYNITVALIYTEGVKVMGSIKDIYEEIDNIDSDALDMDKISEELLHLMSDKDYKPAKLKDLILRFEIPDEDKGKFINLIDELQKEGKIVKTNKDRYMLPQKGLLTGLFHSNKSGFGFVTVEGYDEDFFIASRDTNGAFQGDTVMIKPSSYQRGPRKEAVIERILSRNTDRVIGVYRDNESYGFVVPNDKKIADDIYIPGTASAGAVTGNIVVVTLTSYGDNKKSPEGQIDEILGHIDDPSTDILQVVKAYGIPVDFPEEVEDQLKSIPDEVSPYDLKGRRDFRDINTVTIDGEDAKDLDDAITLEMVDGIYRLGVHIADVTNYVKEASPLDREALERGTSNYLIDSVIPMLPHKLSNGICSLNHDVDRLTLSCVMDIDSTGTVVSHEIVEGVINVNERMNYTDFAILIGQEPDGSPLSESVDRQKELQERYDYLLPMFDKMYELSKILRAKRYARGGVDFDVPETKITVDEDHKPINVQPYLRNDAHKLIEDFMLAANETVAEEYFWADIPFEYRVHETPVVDKIETLKTFAKNFGIYLKTSGDNIHPKEFQKLLKQIEGEPYEQVLSKITLRSMQQARYSTQCIGHFGLACKYYAHFTSPIRRYPDLQIHRIIKENLHGEMNEDRVRHYSKLLPRVAEDNSIKERRAVDAEREVEKLKMIEYISEHIGEEFEGIISGFSNLNIFVELPSTIEGTVRIAEMTDDYYSYHEENMTMVGERTGKVYSLGDTVNVKVVYADKAERAIVFEFV